MIIKQIKLSSQAKEKLSRLKGKTGIKNWDVLCRWALCYSLKENTIPTDVQINADSNVEMSWFTFSGEYSELYEALVKVWCLDKGLVRQKVIILFCKGLRTMQRKATKSILLRPLLNISQY